MNIGNVLSLVQQTLALFQRRPTETLTPVLPRLLVIDHGGHDKERPVQTCGLKYGH